MGRAEFVVMSFETRAVGLVMFDHTTPIVEQILCIVDLPMKRIEKRIRHPFHSWQPIITFIPCVADCGDFFRLDIV